MTESNNKEQEICKNCGFCCDGTLFKRANSFKGEILLPKMEAEIINGSYHFKQPCAYFDQHCTAYDQQRPLDCSTFKCLLLKKSSKSKVEFEAVKILIQQVKDQKSRLHKLIPNTSTNESLELAFKRFLKNNKAQLESTAFKRRYSELLLEWASYKTRLSKFW